MKWLTRIRLRVADAANIGLSDSYAWHQKIWEMFPSQEKKEVTNSVRADKKGGERI